VTKYNNILETIGKTPIIKLNRLATDVKADIYVKVEAFNPGSSVKDRIALAMVEAAEEAGILKEGNTIVEPTSGNTGIGLALVAAVKGYKLILTMPDTMSQERRKILKAFGSELILTPGSGGMKGAIDKATEMANIDKETIFIPQQFKNLANPEIHRTTTGLEIWDDLGGKVDVLVAGIGTGGTITGIGEILKEKNPKLHVIAVEPKNSAILSGESPGPHKIQGIGAGFTPEVLNTKIYDEIITIEAEEAYEASRELAKKEGIFAGISSGAALASALKYAKISQKKENIVVILPDTGERYLSTALWDD
jgi:cysteine synthase